MSILAAAERRSSRFSSIIGKTDNGWSSDDSDCHSEDEENTRHTAQINSEVSKQTSTLTQSQHVVMIPSNGSDDVFSKPDLTPRSLRVCHDTRRGGTSFLSPSPNSNTHMSKQQSSPVIMRPSYSHSDLSHGSLQQQLTDDSGRGHSIERLPTVSPTNDNASYSVVQVHGQEGVCVVMENRYDFDPTKLAEYRKKKKRFGFFRSRREASTGEQASSLNNDNSIKSSSLLSRAFRPPRRSSDDTTVFQPVFRHHSSKSQCQENE